MMAIFTQKGLNHGRIMKCISLENNARNGYPTSYINFRISLSSIKLKEYRTVTDRWKTSPLC